MKEDHYLDMDSLFGNAFGEETKGLLELLLSERLTRIYHKWDKEDPIEAAKEQKKMQEWDSMLAEQSPELAALHSEYLDWFVSAQGRKAENSYLAGITDGICIMKWILNMTYDKEMLNMGAAEWMNLFAEQLIPEVKAVLGSGFETNVRQVKKNNGISRWALEIRQQDQAASPLVYLEPCLEEYLGGKEIRKIAEEIGRFYKREQPAFELDLTQFTEFKQARQRIIYRLVNRRKNQEELKTMPYKEVCGDLAVIYALQIEGEGLKGVVTAKVTNEHMKLWGISDEALWEAAKENTPRVFPARLAGMMEQIKELEVMESREETAAALREQEGSRGQNLLSEEDKTEREMVSREYFFILSNTMGLNGAGVMLYPGVLKRAADRIGDDLLILPSSIHECILMRRESAMDLEEIVNLVREINQTKVKPEEVLSDSAYVYNRKKDCVELAVW